MKIVLLGLLALNIIQCLHGHRKRTHQEESPQRLEVYNFEEFEKKLAKYELFRGQNRILFKIADLHLNNEISGSEYDHFQTIFELPFAECDTSADNLLDLSEIEKCLTSENESPQMKNLHLTKEDLPQVFHFLNKNPEESPTLDLGDYVFLRKVNYAFTKCTTNAQLPKADLPCALQIIQGNNKKINNLQDSEQVFKVFELIKTGRQRGIISTLSVLDFLQISYLYYYFSEFGIPFRDGFLSKQDLQRAIDNQVLPSQLSPFIVEQMYQGHNNQLDFPGFAVYMHLFNGFMQYCTQSNYTISEPQFHQMISSPLVPPTMNHYLSSFINPSQAQVDYIAQQRIQSQAPTEADYFLSFSQIKSKINKKKVQIQLQNKDALQNQLQRKKLMLSKQMMNTLKKILLSKLQKQNSLKAKVKQNKVNKKVQTIDNDKVKEIIIKVVKQRLGQRLKNIVQNITDQVTDAQITQYKQFEHEMQRDSGDKNENVNTEDMNNIDSESIDPKQQKENVRFSKKVEKVKKQEADMSEVVEPEENLKMIFNLFDGMANGQMSFPSYVSLVKMSWSFISFDKDLDELVTEDELKQGLSSFKPPIKFTDQENHALFALNDQWLEMQYYKINIKEFLGFQALQRLIELKVTPDLIGHGSYNNVKGMLLQMGFRTSDITLNICNDDTIGGGSGGNVNRERGTINFYKAFKETLRDELNALAMVYEHRVQIFNQEKTSSL